MATTLIILVGIIVIPQVISWAFEQERTTSDRSSPQYQDESRRAAVAGIIKAATFFGAIYAWWAYSSSPKRERDPDEDPEWTNRGRY